MTFDQSDRYGFAWGPMQVTRAASIPGRGRILTITTDHAEVQVYVSEHGRRITCTPMPPPAGKDTAA